MKFTQDNISRSQKERENSMRLRGEMDTLMRQCNSEMNSNNNLANSAFQTRIQELTDAKNKLQNHLQRVTFKSFTWIFYLFLINNIIICYYIMLVIILMIIDCKYVLLLPAYYNYYIKTS